MEVKSISRLKITIKQFLLLWLVPVPTALFLIIGIYFVYDFTGNSEESISKTVEVINENIKVESDMVNAFIEYAGSSRSGGLKLATGRIKEDHQKNIDSITECIPKIEDIMKNMYKLLYFLLIVMGVQFIFISIVLIKISNDHYKSENKKIKLLSDALNGIKPDEEILTKREKKSGIFINILNISEEMAPIIKRRMKRKDKK